MPAAAIHPPVWKGIPSLHELSTEALLISAYIFCSIKLLFVPASESSLFLLTEQSDQLWIQRDRIHFVLLSSNREFCWVSMPLSSIPQRMRWMLSMPESLSSSRGSMIFRGRRLTGIPSSALAFPWSPNLMPTILRFTMAILMPVKPFSPSVHWCFHCSLDVTPRKRLRWHMSSLFSPAVPANGESPYGDRGLPAVLLLWLFARKWQSSSTDQLREMRRRLSYLGCPRREALSPTMPFSFRLSRRLAAGTRARYARVFSRDWIMPSPTN